MAIAPVLRRPAALRLRAARWAGPAVYVAVLSAFMWRDGVPAARDRLLMWIVLGLLALSLANLRGWAQGVVLEWLPFALVLWAYDLLRGRADELLFAAHFQPQIDADRLLFGGAVPTVWLQEHLWRGAEHLRWYDYAAWTVYMSYFLATYIVAGLLWFVARGRFRRYVATVTLLAALGFATFALFPAAPPWLASATGDVDATTRSIGPISAHVPFVFISFKGLHDLGSGYANPVAAVPSLHAAYTLLIALALWPLARRTRPLLAAYPPAMAFALVYTAEHYAVDILLGWAYAVAAFWAVNRCASRLSARFASSGESRAAAAAPGPPARP